jgi:hypothetical protein
MIWNRSSDFVVSRFFGRILPSDAQTESWIFSKRINKTFRPSSISKPLPR